MHILYALRIGMPISCQKDKQPYDFSCSRSAEESLCSGESKRIVYLGFYIGFSLAV